LRLRNLAKREVVDDLSATAGVGRVATPAKTLSSRMTLTGLPRSRECALRSRRLCTEPLHRGFVDPLQRGYVDQFVVGHGRASFGSRGSPLRRSSRWQNGHATRRNRHAHRTAEPHDAATPGRRRPIRRTITEPRRTQVTYGRVMGAQVCQLGNAAVSSCGR